jgi:hypothetical protein
MADGKPEKQAGWHWLIAQSKRFSIHTSFLQDERSTALRYESTKATISLVDVWLGKQCAGRSFNSSKRLS